MLPVRRVHAGSYNILARYAAGFFSRLRGLMFSGRLKDTGLLIKCPKEGRIQSAIHSFFVFFPIDVVWINSMDTVVRVKRIMPFTFIAVPPKPARYVLELPAGAGINFNVGGRIEIT
ncbi:MAG: hypothetical protein COY53_06180 [Elusimicrobia bacterium CG_4_10_14_0_8_um_filter_37_32]|nr:MAG: hypothetical protein COY53_06180 [Elusimicrobia bacterium CG_4_10_14_0_8_um_filter_37_32]